MTDPHPATAELASQSATALAAALTEGRTTSVAIVEALLARIDAIDAPGSPIGLRSIAALSDNALEQARLRDTERAAGQSLGVLHGLPVLVKDNIEVDGLPGAAGSSALLGRPTHDAELVTRLRQAGAIILGSTNLSEWANIRSFTSTSGWSATGGLVGNPWGLDRSAGGSSSGAGAALAAGLAPLAIGTETDGSIVCPASLNGVAGLKPTVGTISRRGIVPISVSQDSPGPMARHVADVALLATALTGIDFLSATDAPLRIGVATTWMSGHAATDACFSALLAQLAEGSHTLVDRTPAVPGAQEHDDELTVLLAELCTELTAYLAARPGDGVRSLADVVAYEAAHPELELPHFGHELFVRALELGGSDSPEYLAARARNLHWATEECLLPAFGDEIDVLIAPSYGPAWKSDYANGQSVGAASCVTTPAAIAGWPIACVPMGLAVGLPVGVAIVGRPGSEAAVLRAAQALEVPLPSPSWAPAQRG